MKVINFKIQFHVFKLQKENIKKCVNKFNSLEKDFTFEVSLDNKYQDWISRTTGKGLFIAFIFKLNFMCVLWILPKVFKNFFNMWWPGKVSFLGHHMSSSNANGKVQTMQFFCMFFQVIFDNTSCKVFKESPRN